jgi:integrase
VARATRNSRLETREARRKLKARNEPYWQVIDKSLSVGYRKGERGGTWYARQRPGGRYRMRQIAIADDHQDSDGTRVLDYFEAQAEARRDFQKGSPQWQRITVGEAAAHYLEWYREHRKAMDETTATIDAHILPTFGSKALADIKSLELKKWRDKLATRPPRRRTRLGRAQKHGEKPQTDEEKRARKATANRILTVLKAILNKAFKDDLVDDDREWRKVKPFEKVDESSEEIRFLTEAESVRLLNACRADLSKLSRGGLLTGARYGELARIRVRDFDPAGGRVWISSASKAGKGRHVPLSLAGIKFFSAEVAGKTGDELVFTKQDGTRWGKNHHAREFERATARAKIAPPLGFHDLRHTFATHFANIPGNTLDMLAQILGHKDTRITKRHYAHLFDETLKEAMKSMPHFETGDESNVSAIR